VPVPRTARLVSEDFTSKIHPPGTSILLTMSAGLLAGALMWSYTSGVRTHLFPTYSTSFLLQAGDLLQVMQTALLSSSCGHKQGSMYYPNHSNNPFMLTRSRTAGIAFRDPKGPPALVCSDWVRGSGAIANQVSI
jgi:hypothetical protein